MSVFTSASVNAAPSGLFIEVFMRIKMTRTCVADPSREGRSRNNSWLQFNRVFNNRGTASPTRPQSVGGNYSTASALKPRILTYINYSLTVSQYIFTSPCFYHSSENITSNISYHPLFILILQTRLLLSRA